MQALLYLTHRIPYPPNKGDKIRSYHLLQHLSERYRVYLGTFIDDEQDWQYVDQVKSFCEDTCFIKLDPFTARIRSLFTLFSNTPLTLTYYYNQHLQAWVNERLSKESIDHILIFSSAMAQYIDHAKDCDHIVDFVDVDSDKWRQYASAKSWPQNWIYRREAKLLLAYEKQVAKDCDYVTFVSEKEADLFKQLVPEVTDKTVFFNNGVDTDFFSPYLRYDNPYSEGARVLVFTGAMDYWPNVDAVSWFSHAVFPAVRAQLPQVEFYVVGARPSREVMALASLPGITVTGAVEDIRPYMAYASMAVAPLRVARGIQNKVLEAMAMEKIVIVSPQAMEGIYAVPEIELFVASDAGQFIDQIILLFQNNVSKDTGGAARSRVLKDYNWAESLARIDALFTGNRRNDLRDEILVR
ncbi:TIGR03087 family PEP-CTERM/XrtA system glycosyltransferase [Nitrosomonas sp. Nm132]|jgi:sugar transferase (PEP-CTERM/EpsH1 system associated)|uniref:TIGR03087 family PEP-CTERM/XrtA system glycosyltransferase n=1 Tax=Nitrosomonas sp. Nm132 TaxID=1881053 RepID=UPI00087FC5A1|nr:TIGR03087 family PEP-CTERM/XrtA system glycosyltransferase [Nitrosomonas sp. Nm132]SDH23685.1 sugar transferase, PEP-CTERM/EpsH1 system associated [Nitrosomonas sp. Nm132]